MARRTGIEKQLQAALNDAAREGLAIHEAKLIQVRVVALTKLFEHSQTTEKLTAEIRRLTAELDRVKQENVRLAQCSQPKHSGTIAGIDEVLERFARGEK